MRKTISSSKMILLLLHDRIDEQLSLSTKKIPSYIFSQPGIVDAIGYSKQLVSYGIKVLEKEGLVERKRFHIRETSRFRNFYFLTATGIQNAKELLEEIDKTIIKVREKDKTMEMKISDLIKHLKKTAKKSVEINYTNILKNITPEGLLDVRTILEPKKYVDYSERRPELKYFFGREKELNEINDFLRSKSSVLCIRGIAGIGKTVLLSKFLEEIDMNVFWHRFYEVSTLRSLLTKLGKFLSAMDRQKLANYLETGRMDVEEILILLENELKASDTFLVFDDIQKAGKEIVDFFALLKDLKTDLKLIFIGREIPHFYGRRDVVVEKKVREMVLEGLDRNSSEKLLRVRKIEKETDRLYNLTRGHPLMLELITPETAAVAMEYIKEEIAEKLKPEERKCLELASVFRFPFPAGAVINVANYNILDSLVDKSLMQRSLDLYDLHDTVREFFYNRLAENQKIKYHKLVSEYYWKVSGEGALLEMVYHLLKAEKQEKAAAQIVEKGESLAEKGFSKELSVLIKQISEKQVSIARWAEILKVNGILNKLLGEWDEALARFRKCIHISKELDNKKLQGESYRQIGEIFVCRTKYDEALKSLQEALQIFQEINEQRGIAKAHFWLGKASWKTGKQDDATKHLQICLECAEELGDERLRAITYNDIGAVRSLKAEYKKALELTMMCLQYFERTGDMYELARAQNNIGATYGEMNDYKKAAEWYEKSIKTGRDIGIIRAVGYGLVNAAENYAKLGEELEKAKSYVDEALEIFQKLGEKSMISACHGTYGIIYHKKKDWSNSSEHFEKCIRIAKEIEALSTLSYSYHDYGRMLADKGNKAKAKEQFEKSMACYEKLGNKVKVDEVKKELEKLYGP